MPIYEYQCQSCGLQTEVMQRMSEPPLTTCEECGGKLKKLISAPAFQFKGEGWYVTDYAKKDSGKGKGGSSSEGGDSGSGDSKGSDSKDGSDSGGSSGGGGSSSASSKDSGGGSKSSSSTSSESAS